MDALFIPAGELLGPDCRIRAVTIKSDRHLPTGEYHLIDTYCVDNKCDCRKTIIQVYHEDKLVSIVSYGWEQPQFYTRWMGCAPDDESVREMSGVSIDCSSPDLVSREGILILFERLMDEKWISRLKEHYRIIKSICKLDNVISLPPKITRNAVCPCGSGKKYKNCCL